MLVWLLVLLLLTGVIYVFYRSFINKKEKFKKHTRNYTLKI